MERFGRPIGWGASVVIGVALIVLCLVPRGRSPSQSRADTDLQLIGQIKDAVPDQPAQAEALRDGNISATQAMAVCAEAIRQAQNLNTAMTIAVVDAGGHLKTLQRMDDAWIGSIDLAIKKARTASLFNMNTGEIGKLSQPGGPLYHIELTNGGLITFPGGVPLFGPRGRIIGAIGVAGSTVENDQIVAEAAAKVL